MIRIAVRVELWTGWKIPKAASRFNQFLKDSKALQWTPLSEYEIFFPLCKIYTSDLEGAKAILRVTAKKERWPRLKNMFTFNI